MSGSERRRPDGKHRVRFYGHYACPSRGACRPSEELANERREPEHTEKSKRCPQSWARLIHKVGRPAGVPTLWRQAR